MKKIFIPIFIAVLFGFITMISTFVSNVFIFKNNFWIFFLASTFLTALFLITMFLSRSKTSKILSILSIISSVWLGIASYLLIFSIFFFIKKSFINDQNLHQISQILFTLSIGFAFLSYLHALVFEIRVVKIQAKNIPDIWKNRKIVFVSDLHFGAIRNNSLSKRFANIINQINADIVLIGGDLFDGPKFEMQKTIENLKSIKSKHGIYYASGNHEHYGDFENFMKTINEIGIKNIDDSYADIDGMRFAGIGFETLNNAKHDKEKYLETLNYITNTSESIIFLQHVPQNIKEISDIKNNIVLALFGHTHNGQYFPINLIVKLIYKNFAYGKSSINNLHTYTSKGFGTATPPMRLFNRGEIVVIKFD